ncbi:hypothetical protein HID58_014467 [Brassica napus]|uniref:Uncharacterized protein n=1 Tax=Brassica napus TaxID=3708 RepID=A0ABQ8DH85_BRANA|nr:hypothetical protein HID58_014467 [Brassica napus]
MYFITVPYILTRGRGRRITQEAIYTRLIIKTMTTLSSEVQLTVEEAYRRDSLLVFSTARITYSLQRTEKKNHC